MLIWYTKRRWIGIVASTAHKHSHDGLIWFIMKKLSTIRKSKLLSGLRFYCFGSYIFCALYLPSVPTSDVCKNCTNMNIIALGISAVCVTRNFPRRGHTIDINRSDTGRRRRRLNVTSVVMNFQAKKN